MMISLHLRSSMGNSQFPLATIVFSLLLSCAAYGQTPSSQGSNLDSDQVLGKWDCIAKSGALGEMKPVMEINREGDKLKASIRTAQGALATNNVTFADGKLLAVMTSGDGTTGRIVARLRGNRLAGEWSYGPQITGTFGCSRAGGEALGSTNSSIVLPSITPAEDALTGNWDGTLSIPSTSEITFSFQLNLDGNKVSGRISTQQGDAQIKTGSWLENRLAISAELPSGSVNFTGTLQDGKLSGSFDTAGQSGGTWKASKKPGTSK